MNSPQLPLIVAILFHLLNSGIYGSYSSDRFEGHVELEHDFIGTNQMVCHGDDLPSAQVTCNLALSKVEQFAKAYGSYGYQNNRYVRISLFRNGQYLANHTYIPEKESNSSFEVKFGTKKTDNFSCTVFTDFGSYWGENHQIFQSAQIFQCAWQASETIQVSVGDSHSMTCSKAVLPTEWRKHGVELNGSGNNTHPNKFNSRTISNVQATDADVYTCAVYHPTSMRGVRKNITLNVRTAPGVPLNLRTEGKTSETIYLTWEPSPNQTRFLNQTPTHYQVNYGPLSGQGETELISKHTSLTLADLEPSTIYYVRVSAANEVGTSQGEAHLLVPTPQKMRE